MSAETGDYFAIYEEWHRAITGRCGITLTRSYCAERVEALRDSDVPATRQFIDLYGDRYRQRVIGWFERASANL